MRLFKIFVLFLISGTAFGQSGAAMLMTSADAGDTYLLDDYPADAAYSLRLLAADQIDSAAIRVRRSSDNAEQDIGFTSEGYLDTASLKTFVGANSGYVVTWYDQSGNERDQTQSTASAQATIINAGTVFRDNGNVALSFDGSSDYYTLSFTLGNPVSGFIVGTFISALDCMLDGYGAPNLNSIRTTTATELRLFNGTGITRTVALSTRYLISFHNNGATSYLGTNNTYTSGSLGTSSMNGVTIGVSGNLNLSAALEGNIQEVIIYNSDKYADRNAIETEINTHYSIY